MDQTCNVLSLATGAGGLDLGVHLALPNARTVCAVEIEAYACEVLAERMEEGRLDDAPIWTDLRSFDGRPWRGVVDLVIGGYPCQPFSLAGKRLGKDDPRHLWPHVARVVREVQPRAVFFENVLGHVSLGLDLVVRELCEMGYRVEAGIFSAAEVGAPHKRSRVFILGVADPGAPRLGTMRLAEVQSVHDPRGLRVGEDVAHAHGQPDERLGEPRELPGPGRAAEGLGGEWQRGGDAAHGGCEALEHASGERWGEGRAQPVLRGGRDSAAGAGDGLSHLPAGRGFPDPEWPPGPADAAGWRAFLDRWPGAQPAVRRDADVLAARVDRLRLCGNGVVPQQAALAFRELWRTLNTRAP